MTITLTTSYWHSRHLFDIAARSARVTSKKSDHSIIATMFSASALEAFINESIDQAKTISTSDRQKSVDGYAAIMSELEDRKESVVVKYHMALLLFSGETWNEGDPAFQDFKLLVNLRNQIVHLKADRWTVAGAEAMGTPVRSIDKYPKFIEVLHRKKLLSLPKRNTSWLELVRDQRVGRWACEASARVVNEFVSAVPDGVFKQRLVEQAFPMKVTPRRVSGRG